jgi:hypothetical protein
MNKLTITSILILLLNFNLSNAQTFKFIQSNQSPKFIKEGTTSDTLLNPFAGGLNTPQFSNIDWNGDGKQDLFVFDKEANRQVTYILQNGKMIHAPQYEAAFIYFFIFAQSCKFIAFLDTFRVGAVICTRNFK